MIFREESHYSKGISNTDCRGADESIIHIIASSIHVHACTSLVNTLLTCDREVPSTRKNVTPLPVRVCGYRKTVMVVALSYPDCFNCHLACYTHILNREAFTRPFSAKLLLLSKGRVAKVAVAKETVIRFSSAKTRFVFKSLRGEAKESRLFCFDELFVLFTKLRNSDNQLAH
jgi:hypothetical protein